MNFLIRTVSLFITEVCNKACYYCDIPPIKNPKKLNMMFYRQFCEYIKNYEIEFLSLSGGEPGTLSEKDLDEIFNLSPFKIKVNTNGLFIEKGFDKMYKEKIDHICYHLTSADDEIKWKPKGKDYIVYIVTRFNTNRIPTLQRKYNKILFKLYDDKVNLSELMPSIKQITLHKDALHESEFYGMDNLECHVADRQIDLVNGRILKCCKSYTKSPYLQFNEQNLKRLLSNSYCEHWSACDSCLKPLSGY